MKKKKKTIVIIIIIIKSQQAASATIEKAALHRKSTISKGLKNLVVVIFSTVVIARGTKPKE